MSAGAIVNITLPGDPRKNNDRWLRGVCEDARVDTIRKLATQMMSKPADFQIDDKHKRQSWSAKQRTLSVVKGDEDVVPGREVDAKVEESMAAA